MSGTASYSDAGTGTSATGDKASHTDTGAATSAAAPNIIGTGAAGSTAGSAIIAAITVAASCIIRSNSPTQQATTFNRTRK